MAVKMGYTNVMVYRQGILGWAKSGRPLESMAHYPAVNIPIISSLDLQSSKRPRPMILDVRPQSHFNKGHIAGALNIDLEDLDRQLDHLPQNRPIVIVDHKGKLTLTTGRYLVSKGFKDVWRLDGGFNAWVKNGMPIGQ